MEEIHRNMVTEIALQNSLFLVLLRWQWAVVNLGLGAPEERLKRGPLMTSSYLPKEGNMWATEGYVLETTT